MKFQQLKYLVYSDVYRIYGLADTRTLIRGIFRAEAYKYVFLMRLCAFLRARKTLKYTLYIPCKMLLRRYKYKYGISIPEVTNIGPGFYIGHFGGIIVNAQSVLGRNVNISQGVTLGGANRGKNKGAPCLGDNVYVGPGAKIVGSVRVGNNVAIGANCVVTRDVPDGSVVVGVPGRVISQDGSSGYVNRTDYDQSDETDILF